MATLDLNIPVRLRRVLKKATSFNPDERYADIETFKRQVDRATPATAFVLVDGGSELISTDGSVSCKRSEQGGRYEVEVLVNGRRRNRMGTSDLTESEAKRCVQRLVTDYAYP